MAPRTRRRWTTAQKQQIAEEARRRLSGGQSMLQTVRELDVLEGSLRRWMRQFPEGPALKPVRVVADQIEESKVTMVTPDGFRFEELSMANAVLLLEKLR